MIKKYKILLLSLIGFINNIFILILFLLMLMLMLSNNSC